MILSKFAKTRSRMRFAIPSLLLGLIITSSGCKGNAPVRCEPVRLEPKTVYVPKIVHVPEQHTKDVPYPDVKKGDDPIETGIVFQERGKWLNQCKLQLSEIRNLPTDEDGDTQ